MIIFINGCSGPKKLSATSGTEKKLLGIVQNKWLEYKIYQLPAPASNRSYPKGKDGIVISLMVTNKADNTSPLRRLSHNLEEYNVYYEYLLNRAKDDLFLQSGNQIEYPVYYAFENNYNAFPFETINVGFLYRKQRKAEQQLVFIDKLFAKDTVRINFSL